MSSDYYSILKVNKDASISEIKKSYYNLAKKYHPDKAPPNKKQKYTEKFQKLAEAYETLSDENRRKIYDIKNGENVYPFDLFSKIFGKNYNSAKKEIKKVDPIVHKVNVSLEDIFKGFTINLTIVRESIFLKGSETPCSVKELDNSWEECYRCLGRGNILELKRLHIDLISKNVIKCEKCHGYGFILKHNYYLKSNQMVLNIKINPDIGIDYQHLLPGLGNCFPGKYPGDIIVIFEINPHPIYKIEGINLSINKEVSLYDALCGLDFTLNHIDNTALEVKIGDIIKPGKKEIVKGKGIYDKFGKRGDLVINFDIQFPKKLIVDNKEILNKIISD
jgi:DnaJ-class molecular chaperone